MNQKPKCQGFLFSGVLRNWLAFIILFDHSFFLPVDIFLEEFLDSSEEVFEGDAEDYEECSEDEGAEVVA